MAIKSRHIGKNMETLLFLSYAKVESVVSENNRLNALDSAN